MRKRTNLTVILLMLAFTLSGQRLKVSLPEGLQTHTAVIVCPGGSYCWLSKKTEGTEVARWLNANGIAAYVLFYPTAGWAGYAWHSRLLIPGHQHPDAINALNSALRQVRAAGYSRVGVIGFSAGGHLALTSAAYSPRDIAPDFVGALYPVVTLSHPSVHRRSRRGLLGEYRWRNRALRDSLSMERHADRMMCPVFLANCKDDPVVKPHNAVLMDSALTACGKPHTFIQYNTGGHGFGTDASKTSPEAITWKEAFLNFIRKLGS